jgi:hypothetical protein
MLVFISIPDVKNHLTCCENLIAFQQRNKYLSAIKSPNGYLDIEEINIHEKLVFSAIF